MYIKIKKIQILKSTYLSNLRQLKLKKNKKVLTFKKSYDRLSRKFNLHTYAIKERPL